MYLYNLVYILFKNFNEINFSNWLHDYMEPIW